jgi:hypothetical protein
MTSKEETPTYPGFPATRPIDYHGPPLADYKKGLAPLGEKGVDTKMEPDVPTPSAPTEGEGETPIGE